MASDRLRTTRRGFLRAGAAGAAALGLPGLLRAAGAAAPARQPPNFLVILADDMGFADAGCYGGEIDTPVIDGLASRGVRFTQCYNTGRCWPTRTSLLTGYYYEQVGGRGTPERPRKRILPEYLRPLGYRSYHFGKWHLRTTSPEAGGFDRSFAMLGENDYFHPDGSYDTVVLAEKAVACLREHAARHADTPFFAYMAFHAPHFPLQALQEDIALYRDRYLVGWDTIRRERWERQKEMGIVDCALAPLESDLTPRYWNEKYLQALGPGEVSRAVPWETLSAEQRRFQATKMAIHAAMVHRMDREIGRILAQIQVMGQLENTVVLFLSDNGTDATVMVRGGGHDPKAPPGSDKTFLCLGPGWSSAGNTPFRMHKIWVHEGGISTPLVAFWPVGLRAPGELRRDLCHVIDVVPTLIDLAGGAVRPAEGAPPFPGRSLVPALAKDGAVPRDELYFNHAGNRALREERWKIVSATEHGDDWELYDMAADRCEMHDLGRSHPDEVRRLSSRWQSLTTQYARDAGGGRR